MKELSTDKIISYIRDLKIIKDDQIIIRDDYDFPGNSSEGKVLDKDNQKHIINEYENAYKISSCFPHKNNKTNYYTQFLYFINLK